MPSPNFFLQDVRDGVLAAAALTPVFVAPGYALGWVLDVHGFRTRGIAARAALAVVLSVAVGPTLAYLIARTSSLNAAVAVYATGTIALVATRLFQAARGRRSGAHVRLAATNAFVRTGAAASLVWMAYVLFATSDFESGTRLYASGIYFDYAKHISVTDAIVRTGVPPANPSYFPGHPVALYYYYYWFLLCALAPAANALITARAAVVGGTIWAGVALISAVALYAGDVWPAPARTRVRGVRVALAFLLVSGFDVVVVVTRELRAALHGRFFLQATVEWWNEQVTAWTNAALWVPHHTAAVVSVLTAWLLLREATARTRPTERWALAATCGVALASAFGLSVWVTVSFAAFWGAWVIVGAIRGWRDEIRIAVISGILGALLALPFVRDLAHANLDPGHAPLALTIRQFWPLDQWLYAHHAPRIVQALLRTGALPINYLAEFGFFAVSAVVYWWWRARRPEPLTRDEWALLTLAASSLFVGTFVKSAIRNNDLGWRGVMTAQFVTLLWATDVWLTLVRPAPRRGAVQALTSPLPRFARVTLLASLIVGAATAAYDPLVMRTIPLLHDIGVGTWNDRPQPPVSDGARLYAFREAYAEAARRLPAAAVIQPNPAIRADPLHYGLDTYSGVYAARQLAAGDREYGTLYGISPDLYARVASPIVAAFGDPVGEVSTGAETGTPDSATIGALCRRFGITAWFVTITDPVWQQPDSWVWTLPPIFANRLARVVSCPATGDVRRPAPPHSGPG